jgi:aquaporin Z
MARFNPAVTLGFLITKHITRIQLFYYFAAEITGTLSASLFIKFLIENQANLGANAPNFAYPILFIIGFEVFASAMLMSVIYVVVYTKGLRGFSGNAIGVIVGLDIFFLAFISGASMNPARSLAPALVTGVLDNLWLYWSATFVDTSILALVIRRMIVSKRP